MYCLIDHPLYFFGDKKLTCQDGATIKDDSECEEACTQLKIDIPGTTIMKMNDFCFKDGNTCYKDNVQLSNLINARLICKKEGELYARSCRSYTTTMDCFFSPLLFICQTFYNSIILLCENQISQM